VSSSDSKPNIGDIVSAKDIGFKYTGRYIWAACPDCGLERWKRKDEGSSLCRVCALKNRKSWVDHRNPHWTGGRIIKKGYIKILLGKEHPCFSSMVDSTGYILEHRMIMAKHLGRLLEKWEIVHHINEDRQDNRLENLELLPNKAEHRALTAIQEYIHRLEGKIQELSERLSKYEEV